MTISRPPALPLTAGERAQQARERNRVAAADMPIKWRTQWRDPMLEALSTQACDENQYDLGFSDGYDAGVNDEAARV